jgi:hypothetical protein
MVYTSMAFRFRIWMQKYKLNTNYYPVGFEVLTAVVMKSIIFWNMTPCSPLSFNRRFGGT